MIQAVMAGAAMGAWCVGFGTVVFAGLTILAGIVKLGRAVSGESKKDPE